jgi:hypothetical protein
MEISVRCHTNLALSASICISLYDASLHMYIGAIWIPSPSPLYINLVFHSFTSGGLLAALTYLMPHSDGTAHLFKGTLTNLLYKLTTYEILHSEYKLFLRQGN